MNLIALEIERSLNLQVMNQLITDTIPIQPLLHKTDYIQEFKIIKESCAIADFGVDHERNNH